MTDTCRPLTLSTGDVAWVDAGDYADLSVHLWQRANGYASRRVGLDTIYMHDQILGCKNVDHANGRKLDNRRCNLRQASKSQNGANRGKQAGRYSSRFKGVSWFARDQYWEAYIQVNGTKIRLGAFSDEIDAAKAYDAAALKYFGEFSRANTYQELEHVPGRPLSLDNAR